MADNVDVDDPTPGSNKLDPENFIPISEPDPDNINRSDQDGSAMATTNMLDAIVTSENRDARELFGLHSDRMLRKFVWNFQDDPSNYKTSERCMAHKDGKRDVWLNIGVSAKIISITIEYDRNGEKIKRAEHLTAYFTRGQFDASQFNNYAGEQFSATVEWIDNRELSFEILDYYKVKYDFTKLRNVKALYIKDGFRDFLSLSVVFTDYAPSTVVHPKMSQPVTNYVHVWDSYCKTSTNYGHASLAYMVSSKQNTTTHRVQTGEERPKDYSHGIRSSLDTFYGLFDPNADKPIFLSIYFGKRIRLCSFILQLPETILSSNGTEQRFNRAPAGLKLFMDGNLKAIVKEESDSEFVDMMHWYKGRNVTPLKSSFMLVWDLKSRTKRPVGLRRVTIGYAHADRAPRVWRSAISKYREEELLIDNDPKSYADDWKMYAIEHPNVDMSHFTTKPPRPAPTFNAKAANDQLDSLYHPFKVFSPVRAATNSYDFLLSQYPELLEKPENYYPYLPICLMFEFDDARGLKHNYSDVTLLGFVINFPRFGTEERNKDTKYYQRNRSSVYELVAYAKNNTEKRTIATYESWQIPLEKLDLLDYRKTQSLQKINKLMLTFNIQDLHDFDESSINSIEIYYTKGQTYQKSWESTYRLTDTTPFYPNHFGSETDFYLKVVKNTSNNLRTPGHFRQMITEGLPNYFYAHPSEIQGITIDCFDTIVMTSFVFETVRKYQINSYSDVTLEAKVHVGKERRRKKAKNGAKVYRFEWEVFCRTPDAEKTSENEPFTPGDFLEMFDHKINKTIPFKSSNAFRLMFQRTLAHLAIGKISIGYNYIKRRSEIKSKKWTPEEKKFATMTIKDGDNSTQSLSMLKSSTIESPWHSLSFDPEITINFDMQVTFLDVVLKPAFLIEKTQSDSMTLNEAKKLQSDDIKASFKNIELIIARRNGKKINVAFTNGSFDAGSETIALHFFNRHSNPMQIDNNYAYIPGLRRGKKVTGKTLHIKWQKKRTTPVKLTTIEVTFQRKYKQKKAENACLAAHNQLRFRHGIRGRYRYRHGNKEIRDSAKVHAKWLLKNRKFQHSSQSKYGENLCRIQWNSWKPSREDKLAIASFAVEEWYKEWYNYSTKTHDWNGNIFHDEQIGHFLQIIWDGKKGNNRIGVGIASNKKYTIVVVQYENKRRASEKNVDKIHNVRNQFPVLTIQEEEDLRNFMKNSSKECDFLSRGVNNHTSDRFNP